ncbi:major Facilitator Superfamily protein [Paramyrothecium foliicola]|nr:major Facilitator Superfamily protein [Paramyrothecium foliicola]
MASQTKTETGLQPEPAVAPLASEDGPGAEVQGPHGLQRGVRFWGIFVALCTLAFISALDVAIVTTALPTITEEIGGARQYVWVANSFIVASCVVQPLFGQLADAFGRRTPMIVSVALFALGSGIGGGANGVGMLIAGRTIQGVGAGGIYVLLDVVCCDLVPLRDRGKYLGLMFSWSGVAAALGPPVGGAIAEADWRWIFYLNLPICGVALAVLLAFMKVNTGPASTNGVAGKSSFATRASQIDYLGNAIFIPSMVALLIGLIEGGIEHPWSSWRIIVPLVLGAVGWIVFHITQFYVKLPSVPTRIFGNRTSAAALVLTFTSSILVQAASYFLPVYFQAVKATTVLDSGTFFLPFALGTLVCAMLSGILLSKLGAYRPLHALGFAFSAIGFGLFTLLKSTTPSVAWAFFQLISSAGSGLIMSVLLPAIMAPLSEKDVAVASAVYSFVRTFGYIWGVTIASLVFNSVFEHNLSSISDETLRARLQGGAAYSFASQANQLQRTVDPVVWVEITRVYELSLRTVWWVCAGISILSFFLVGLERGLELRTELETNYGLEEKPASPELGTATNEHSRAGEEPSIPPNVSALGREVIDRLIEGGQHEVLALARKLPETSSQQANVNWTQVSFEDKFELVRHLRGVDVLLSFIVINDDPENVVGKLLVDAAVAAGLKRFAPSEWATKLTLHAYLRELNKEKKVLEYTLFQPGVSLDYLAYPQQPNKYLPTLTSPWMVEQLRIVAVKDFEDMQMTFTAAKDIANAIRLAIEYKSEWPEVGGISGIE